MGNKIEDLHPFLQTVLKKFLDNCKKQKLNVFITQTYRTFEEQQALYNQGRTKPGKIVTNCKPGWSMHNYGLAWDIGLKTRKGKVTWDNVDVNDDGINDWLNAGLIGESLGLTWGGRFKNFLDMPHYEYSFGLTIQQLYAGFKPPSISTSFNNFSLVKNFKREEFFCPVCHKCFVDNVFLLKLQILRDLIKTPITIGPQYCFDHSTDYTILEKSFIFLGKGAFLLTSLPIKQLEKSAKQIGLKSIPYGSYLFCYHW